MNDSISKLWQNEELRKSEFPVCRERIYLAHAGVCPLPHKVTHAIADFSIQLSSNDQEAILPKDYLRQTRQACANLLQCGRDEISLVGPTSVGLSLIAQGLDWQVGDNVVYYPQDYPSNAIPWMNLAERGVETRELQTPSPGDIKLENLEPLVDSKTRLVSLASTHFLGGQRLDVDEIGGWLHDKGVLFCVDGIQSLGAFETSVEHVDFLAADAHKWLLGPCASGILYVSKESSHLLQPKLLGWHNVACPNYITQPELKIRNGEGRYEAGSANLLGIVGLRTALELLSAYGHAQISKHLLEHTHWLRNEIQNLGFDLCHQSDERLSGITSFTSNHIDLKNTFDELLKKDIVVSLRKSADGRDWIRISPHFYNTPGELQRMIDELSSLK